MRITHYESDWWEAAYAQSSRQIIGIIGERPKASCGACRSFYSRPGASWHPDQRVANGVTGSNRDFGSSPDPLTQAVTNPGQLPRWLF